MVHAKHHGYVDNATLTRLTGQHPADISKVLVSLRNRQLLQMVNRGRSACYELGSLGISGTKIPTNTSTSATKQETIPENLWNELMQIGAIVRDHSRVERVTLEKVLVQLCSLTPLAPNDLVIILECKKYYLLKVIRTLLASGSISYLYSDQPSHPRQKYIATEIVGKEVSPQQTSLDFKSN